jgi:hypothetical protein
MERKEKKGKKGSKGKVALKDVEVSKVKGGVEAEDPKGGAAFDAFLKFEGVKGKFAYGKIESNFPKIDRGPGTLKR